MPSYFTPALKHLIKHFEDSVTPDEFNVFMKETETLYRYYFDYLAGFEPGAERARQAHNLMEQELYRADKSKVTCHLGCAACCGFEVEVSNDEAQLLAELVVGGMEIDRERLAKLARRQKDSGEWYDRERDNRCVFLSRDNACRIYEFRPLVCRKCLVTSEPSQCGKEDGLITPYQLPILEIIMSAAISQSGVEIGSLPKQLYSHLNLSK